MDNSFILIASIYEKGSSTEGTAADKLIFIRFFEHVWEKVTEHLFYDVYEPFPDYCDGKEPKGNADSCECSFHHSV